ncbi:MAG TPA: hypothetical protein VEB21_11950, partial [Terriglobales bacterium]|nr:hypothetical protein [Terriglobales bacterium]
MWLIAGATAVLIVWPFDARASCNQIPGTVEVFRGAVGSTNRPFAGPGDFVELRPSGCGFGAPFDAAAEEYVVSVVFTPPAGRASLVALAADCAAVAAELGRCGGRDDVGISSCISHADSAVHIVERDGERRLLFRFPDTDSLFAAADDDRTLAGPAAIAVTRRDAALPCELASEACEPEHDRLFCLDRLFALDNTCGSEPHSQFTHFTALPPPNNFQALCVDPSPPCTGAESELRFTADADGNLLFPVDWRGILLGEKVPIARLLRGSTSIEAFPHSDAPLRIPGKSFLRSFSPTGGPLPPIFEPQLDPSAPHELTLFGSADAPQTVLWFARRSSAGRQCYAGAYDGLPCNEASDCPAGECAAALCRNDSVRTCNRDSDCPTGECGAALFDFRSRTIADNGLIMLSREGTGTCQTSGAPCSHRDDCGVDEPCVTFRLRAEDAVPLDSLIESAAVFVSVVPEAIAARDLNGDGDRTDNVTLLNDRRTGLRQPIGESFAPGRATTRLHQPPFVYSAVAAEDDIVALLEAEPLQGNRDANDDGDRFDSILRVFRS